MSFSLNNNYWAYAILRMILFSRDLRINLGFKIIMLFVSTWGINVTIHFWGVFVLKFDNEFWDKNGSIFAFCLIFGFMWSRCIILISWEGFFFSISVCFFEVLVLGGQKNFLLKQLSFSQSKFVFIQMLILMLLILWLFIRCFIVIIVIVVFVVIIIIIILTNQTK